MIAQRLDKLASDLESAGLGHLASMLDVVANTVEFSPTEDEKRRFGPGGDLKLFCDMDSVLVDFMDGYRKFGMPAGQLRDVPTMGVPLDLEVAGKSAFWSGLDWMPSGKTLWNFIKDLHPTLLTAPPMNLEPSWEATKVGKKIWAENNLGAGVPMIVDIDKEKYVKGPQSILIDDSKHNKGPWEKNKGSFIWHGGGEKNFHVVDNGRGSVLESIRQLRDLVSKLPEHGKEAP